MLNIIYNPVNGFIRNGSVFFNNTYKDEWFEDEFVKKMILDIDKSEVIGPHLIQSPVLGPISYKELSGGVKTLILMYEDSEHIFNATSCGENCAKWILEIANKKDLTIALSYPMHLSDGTFDGYFVNSGKKVTNMLEVMNEIIDLGDKVYEG